MPNGARPGVQAQTAARDDHAIRPASHPGAQTSDRFARAARCGAAARAPLLVATRMFRPKARCRVLLTLDLECAPRYERRSTVPRALRPGPHPRPLVYVP